jgi:hypothetical protein
MEAFMSILKFIITLLIIFSPQVIIAGEKKKGILKKCRPDERRVVRKLRFTTEAAAKLCGLIQSANQHSLYYFENALFRELKRVYRETGICYYLSDPEVYYSVECKNRGLLHFAALKMKKDFIDEFVSYYRINVNIQDREGYTIYDYADLTTNEITARLTDETKLSRKKVLKEELVLWGKFKEYLIDEFNAKPCRAVPAGLRRIKKCPYTGR